MIRYSLILIICLIPYWLGLSGYLKPMLLSLGAISIALVLYMCARMKILDKETVPYLFVPKTLAYFSWLGREIVKANIIVVKAVLRPDMEVTPTLVKVKAPQKTDIGRSMFGNSITLTPGTVTMDFEGDEILVHALLKEMAKPADFTEMGQRAAWSVGDSTDGKNAESA